MRRTINKIVLSGLALIIIFAVFIGQNKENRYLEVTYLDIGQGDAALITTTNDQHILIDCGPDQQILSALSRHLNWWNKNLDFIIISHDHADHWGGLSYVLKKYNVHKIILARPPKLSTELTAILAEAKQKNVNIIDIRAPALITLADGSQLNILWPTNQQLQQYTDDINNQSLVFSWAYGDSNFLWSGDLETTAENKLLAIRQEHPVDVLKIAHHGSWTATGLSWLAYWQPTWAVISVGANNQFGLPSQLTIDRLQRLGIHVWRTDQLGDFQLYSDGQKIWHPTR
jgi:competence protein ComEC